MDVNFDDFAIYHGMSNVAQIDDYYPFVVQSGVSTRLASIPLLLTQRVAGACQGVENDIDCGSHWRGFAIRVSHWRAFEKRAHLSMYLQCNIS